MSDTTIFAEYYEWMNEIIIFSIHPGDLHTPSFKIKITIFIPFDLSPPSFALY